jgi:hypothetical protein
MHMSAAWEECKENYVPVKEGRKPALLSPVAPVPPSELETTRKCVDIGGMCFGMQLV